MHAYTHKCMYTYISKYLGICTHASLLQAGMAVQIYTIAHYYNVLKGTA